MAQPSVRLYYVIWIALLALLGATYFVGDKLDLGDWNFVIAFGIALTKATLIVLFFMHIRYSPPLVRLVACAGFFFLAIMLGLTICDVASRHGTTFSSYLTK